ncbi:MAG: radical SAM protein [Alphaproteobacteria bacterium]|nr:radical SAM protein [Alphaproteobacteria bacterium]
MTTILTTGGSSRDAMVRLAAEGQSLPSPVEAYFEVANRCNSKCATCPLTFSPQEKAKQLSIDEFKILVDQLPDLRRAVMQGIGEPLLNRDLAAMIRHLKRRGVYVVFNTNAALLTRRRQVELIESGLDELRVSVDGSTPETYLKLRGIPAFDRVVANVGEMVRTQRELGASTPRLSFWVTGLHENLHELPGVIDLAARIGVPEVYLQRMVFGFLEADGTDEVLARADQSIYDRRYRDEAETFIAEAERRAHASGVRFRGADALTPRESIVERPAREEPWRACSRPLRLAYITAQGTALPCCIAPFTDAPYESIRLGNYLDHGVEAVWNGEAYRKFRARLYSSNPPPSCRNCGLAWSL